MSARHLPRWLLCLATLGVSFPGSASAHRLDEYLQATRISLEVDHIGVEINLTPGAAVADRVFEAMDLDGNGALSPAEEAAYANLVVGSVSLRVDDRPQRLLLQDYRIPTWPEMRRGEGVIRLLAAAAPAPAEAGRHQLMFANAHRSDIAVYLVNALIPADERIRITAQSRDMLQREFSMEYTVSARERKAGMAPAVPALIGVVMAAALWAIAKRLNG